MKISIEIKVIAFSFPGLFCGPYRNNTNYILAYPICRVCGWVLGLLLDIGLQQYRVKCVILPIIFITILVPHLKMM